MSNKKIGNNFENEFAEYLSQKGYWVHLLNQNVAGQPADIIAVKNEKALLIDCKVCSGKSFNTSRIEDNQEMAMTLWKERGNGDGLFAIKLQGEVFIVTLDSLLSFPKKRLIYEDLKQYNIINNI